MIKVNIGEYQIDFPTSWHDFTVEDGQKIVAAMGLPEWSDPVYRISLYTKVQYQHISSLNLTQEEIDALSEFIAWETIPVTEIADPSPACIHFFSPEWIQDWTIRVPKESIHFKDKKIRIPGNLEIQPVGSKIMFDQLVTIEVAKSGNIIPFIHYAVATYMQPLYFDNHFDGDQVMQLAEICKRCNFVEALSAAAFFLTKHQLLHSSKKKSSDTSLQEKKLKPELMTSHNTEQSTISIS